jgi:hypothetical protein
MIYREPGSQLGRRNTERLRKMAKLLTEEGGGGGAESYDSEKACSFIIHFNTLCVNAPSKTSYSGKIAKNGWDLLSLIIPVTGEGDRVEDHAFAASIPPALPADAEEEELAVCSRKSNGLIPKC